MAIRGGMSMVCGGESIGCEGPVIRNVALSTQVGRVAPLDALVDSGASLSVVPLAYFPDVRLAIDWREFKKPDRSQPTARRPVYLVRLTIPGLGELEAEAFALNRPSILLGREFFERHRAILVVDHRWRRFAVRRQAWISPLLCRMIGL